VDYFLRPHSTWYNFRGDIFLRKINLRILAIFLGYGISLASQFVMFATFLAAYFYSEHFALITINTFNEMHIELVFLIIMLWISMGGFIFLLAHVKVNRKQKS
jgi:heme/copper-type cytochrome/quinol oxidase subunit 3